MGLKSYKPTSPGTRGKTVINHNEVVTRNKPEKSLVVGLRKKGGRNNTGKITVRHQGGGNKRLYRIIDFKRNKIDIPAKVSALEYDPNRSAYIALLTYVDGEKSYIIAPQGLRVGDKVISSENAEISIGNCLPLGNIPVGTFIHNIELVRGNGAVISRSAGTASQIVAKEGGYAHVRLTSGEIRKIHLDCRATIGQVGNLDHENVNLGKAGTKRYLGIRPTVRGSAMNPIDHPHGGGEGKAKIGHAGPLTPWGKPTLGYKTRNKKKISNKFIIKRRK